MKKDDSYLSVSQFAKLHEVNKRTLHYYDSIGLFSPEYKGENNYRYYDTAQSVDFEYIRMLKELNMSIEEIQSYLKNPNPEEFIEIVDHKTEEINAQIQKLKRTRQILQYKKIQLQICETVKEDTIKIVNLPDESIRCIPFDNQNENLSHVFSSIKKIWGIEQCRMGVGSIISIDKVLDKKFDQYDGLYTHSLKPSVSEDVFVRKGGRFLCGYGIGSLEHVSGLYEKMLRYARDHNLELSDYWYEYGMNDFAITCPEEHITQILVRIQ